MQKKFVLILSFFLVSIASYADFVWTAGCFRAYDCALRLNFKESENILAKEKIANSNNKIILYIESQIDFLRSFISEDEIYFEQLKKNNEKRIDILQTDNKKDPYYRLCIAEMYMQIAISRLKFDEYLSAVYDIRKSYKQLEENQELFPNFKPNLRGLGFVHAVVGSIPKNFGWAVGLIGLDGTVKQGLSELRTLYTASLKQPELNYLKDETIVLLTFLEFNLGKEKDEEMMRKRFQYVQEINEKPLVMFAKSVFHFANSENDSVVDLLSKRKKNTGAEEMYYLDFMEGSARLHQLDFSAEKNLRRYLANYKGKSYTKSTYQRIAWCKLLQGDTTAYLQTMKSCLAAKKESLITDEDKQAAQDAQSNEIPNIYLLRCRLLFDGGYYQRALNELAGKPITTFTSTKDKLEFTYRLARIFDKTEKTDKAIQFYEETYKNGATKPYYFSANSALFLGQIYEDKKDTANAITYYNKALALRNHDYQNSIDQKAKSGLNRIQK
jgi:hypothetical protein